MMLYRKLPHGTEQISVIGLGTSSVGAGGQAEKVMEEALESGINYFDMASGDAAPFPAFGSALRGMRNKAYLQIHFGANYATGKYGWTCDLDEIKRSIEWQLASLQTDYIDFGFIHCIDEQADLDRAISSGTISYIQALKAQGTVRHIGLSSHSPSLANAVLDMGILDMLMFSINPAYDYQQGDEYAIGSAGERAALYRHCEKAGVGISVMKPFCGGRLLHDSASPFRHALSAYQCIQYALDKPGVLTVLPGVRNVEDLRRVLGFFTAADAKRDYSALGAFTPQDARGSCVYCNHCQPCPAGLDVGMINRYYDLALAGDTLAAEHYNKLQKTAADCTGCGHCDSRCPFGAEQSRRMQEILAYFGK